MPNCDFYASGADFDDLLDFVFAQADCRVFESYSPFDQELIEFHSKEEIAARYPVGVCRGNAQSVLLDLLARRAGGQLEVRRIDLKPGVGATFRYAVNGWGLISLQLGGVGPQGLVPSHTNHNSEKRALAWAPAFPELGGVAQWNWAEVTRTSNRINRHIRTKLAVAKIGSRAVLRDAQAQLAAALKPLC